MGVVDLLAVVVAIWLMLAVLMAVAWQVEQRTGNSGWVDVVWTGAMALTGIAGAIAVSLGNSSTRHWLVAGMVLIWALRLGGHIARRTTTISDDPRYARLREKWGATAARNMFWLLQGQAALSVPMVLSIVLGAWNPAPMMTPTDWIGLSVFCVGLAGSALADRQLRRFKERSSRGAVCDVGLWAWSRHPNYFFEWLIWLSYALIAIDPGGGWNWGYVALVGPACMFWLLRYVSGVPPLEAHMLEKYGAAYENYQQRTSVFFPQPPGRASR